MNIYEMVGIIAPWANDAKRKALFLSIPEVAAFHPKIVENHAELLSAQPTSADVSSTLQKIIDRRRRCPRPSGAHGVKRDPSRSRS